MMHASKHADYRPPSRLCRVRIPPEIGTAGYFIRNESIEILNKLLSAVRSGYCDFLFSGERHGQ